MHLHGSGGGGGGADRSPGTRAARRRRLHRTDAVLGQRPRPNVRREDRMGEDHPREPLRRAAGPRDRRPASHRACQRRRGGAVCRGNDRDDRRFDGRAPDPGRGRQGGRPGRARTPDPPAAGQASRQGCRRPVSGVRGSQLLIPTLKDDPTDAEAISRKLLVRGGFIRQVGSGLYTYLPLGWRVMRQIDTIIREEMDTIGQEMLMPVLNPAELWQRTGRWDIEQLYKLTDSSGKHYALAMTHEECVTFHASREIRSYKELPQIWYHIQTKERDEPRPKSGILRTREFIMKDSYSLDCDEEGLDASYQRHIEVYKRIYDRCGLEYWMVESDVGMMGGLGAHEFMAPSSAGEDEVALCSSCDYAANVELARSRARAPEFPERLDAPRDVETPGVTTIEGLAELLGIDPAATAKAMVVVCDGEVVLGLVRGDHRLHELKMARALGGEFRPATREEIVATFGAEPGSIGAVGVNTRIIADEALREGQFVGGANRTGHHLLGVEAGRDYQAEFADIREV